MINTVVLVGRLTKEVEVRQTKSGRVVINITLAVKRNFTDSKDNQVADFIPVVLWENTARHFKLKTLALKHNGKGALISVTGRLQTRTYQNDAGNTVFVTEVVAENVDYLS